tara:strand:- start:3431 stop:4900 length:1470 start_codon:yes stop_codon:yes gene_type:complete
MKIKKVAIANRGEVAVRIIKACNELNIKTLLLHSEADVHSRAYRMADETICIGPSPSSESYLSIEANIAAAKQKQADALHPGFGFLSENAAFAKACEDAGIRFIGPSEKSIRLFGDKISAKDLVGKVGVPMIPGYQGDKQDEKSLIQEAEKIGYPVLVKAASGGGGRGMKVLRNSEEAGEWIASAKREAKQAFGDERVFLEKYIENPKHIEVQIFADAKGEVFHLYERECSVQRRHQKVIEEAGENILPVDLRARMCEAAIKIAKEANYKGAGTVEFLLEGSDFYFLEMNTRLQVEHPVSEMVTGKDLVQAQILTAAGVDLGWKQEEISLHGHSIECRLYAEDAYNKGIPSTGKLLAQEFSETQGARFDYGFEAGDIISAYYDSMIAKLIVWGKDRKQARSKMLQVLSNSVVFGIHTNIPYLKAILQHPEFIDASMTTSFIGKYFPEGLERREYSEEEKQVFATLYFQASKSRVLAREQNPWSQNWRLP